jgi:hypothetical protein
MPFTLVLFEGVRSAEPPSNSGTVAARWSSTAPLAERVAISLPLAMNSTRAPAIAFFQSGGNFPSLRRSNSKRNSVGALLTRSAQAMRALRPLEPISRHSRSNGSGITNGGDSQPRILRAPAISSSPGASLWAFWVPALVGKPKPMMVLQAIIDGLSVTARAAVMASRIASVSWPSISWTCQPEARKRSTSLSDTARLVAPSIVIELLSQKAIRWPSS